MTEDGRRSKKTDLVLSNGEFAFTQDSTTGSVKVLTGPTVVNVTGQESPVVYESAQEHFVAVELEDAAQKSPLASQGYYVELWNPPATESGAQPTEGSKETAPKLLMGQRVNIPGPTTFALWPRQIAKVIEGHHLRSNQYLLGRIYDEEAAKANWQKAVLKVASRADEEGSGVKETGTQGTITELTEEDLSVGKLFVIKGTEVSFYMPPTGVEVVPDENGRFVRDALTLERLQYCILVDENGDKAYQRGPRVVFPKPTQRFFSDERTGASVFRPTELNPIQGIHVKVIAPYTEGDRTYNEGEELFITGQDTSIYFPRPEHSLIKYDGNAKHFATAVPEGEARYVMDRTTGVIRMVRGPTMLLPDPRSEVMVRRVLSEEQCKLWYPGNEAVAKYNGVLRDLQTKTPSTRSAVSEGEVRRSKKAKVRGKELGIADSSSVHSGASGAMADEWMRTATYSEPRTLTLETRFAGVPSVRVWTGYAVMVQNKRGERRVEMGPKSLLLRYDETLEVFELSTGVPKNAEQTEKTAYLKVRNNLVEDLVLAHTKDHVTVTMKYALTVDFVGDDPSRWFAADNYVKLLCDQTRVLIKRALRETTIEALYEDPARIVRGAISAGASDEAYAPLRFEENGMEVRQVEVLMTKIADAKISKMFEEAQTFAVASNIDLERARKRLELDRAQQELERTQAQEAAQTERFKAQLEFERIKQSLELARAQADAEIAELAKKREAQQASDELVNERQTQALARQERAEEQKRQAEREALAMRSEEIKVRTEAAVARFKAAEGPFAEAIQLLGNQEVLAKVAEATSAQRLLGGKDVVDVLSKLFEGTQLMPLFEKVEEKAIPAPRRKNGQVS